MNWITQNWSWVFYLPQKLQINSNHRVTESWFANISTIDDRCNILAEGTNEQLLDAQWPNLDAFICASVICHYGRSYDTLWAPPPSPRPPYQWTNRYVLRAQNSNLESSIYDFHIDFGFFDPITSESTQCFSTVFGIFFYTLSPSLQRSAKRYANLAKQDPGRGRQNR